MNGGKHGYGIFRWADGDVYFGEWKKNKREGHGYMRYVDGGEYCGEWKNGEQWREEANEEKQQL